MNETVLSNLNVITKVLEIYHPIDLNKPIFTFNLAYLDYTNSSLLGSYISDKLIFLIVSENSVLSVKIISMINFNRQGGDNIQNIQSNEDIIWCNKNYDFIDKNLICYTSTIDNLLRLRINEGGKINSFDLSSASIKQKYKQLKDKINIVKNTEKTPKGVIFKPVIDLLTENGLYKISVNFNFDETLVLSKLNEMKFDYYVYIIFKLD